MATSPEPPSPRRHARASSPAGGVRGLFASPLPKPAQVYVAPGSYGAAPHVPFAPYVPPLPPAVTEASSTSLRVVTEDPLAFLAAQAAAQRPPRDPAAPPAPAPASRRFRATPEADAPRRPEARRGSVPPPGYR